MQNSKTTAFTQFQSNNGLGNQKNEEKNTQLHKMDETDSNPKRERCLYPLQVGNIMVYQCQLILNYPESQQHTQTIENDDTIEDKERIHQECEVQCNNCIDIDSIMNQNNAEAFPAYNANNSIQINEKVAPQTVPLQQQGPQYKERDQTKNIPKNYIKAVFSFLLENPQLIKRLLIKKRNQFQTCEINKFLEHIRLQKKSKVYTIGRLRQMWLNEDYGKVMRMVYAYFLRKRTLQYIYGSKIENKMSHAKYRCKLLQSLENPVEFTSFK